MLIADDHEVVRFGLRQVAEEKLGFANVLEAASFDEALEQLGDPALTLAIVDLSMPGLARTSDLVQIRRQRPDIRLIVLSGSSAREDILAALEAGAHGYIVKTTRTDTLVANIETVLGGAICVPPSLADLPAEPGSAPLAGAHGEEDETGTSSDLAAAVPPNGPLATLTERQCEVLKLIVEGRSNKEIAIALKIAEGTVKMHVTAILRATGARNRAHAAAIGRRFIA